MYRHARTATLLVCALLFPVVAFAQASLNGTVRDASGAILPGVTVEAASPVLIEKVRTAVTEGNGQFTIVNLRPGTYTITFTLPGFQTIRQDGVTLTGSATTTVNAEMRVGAVEETVTVTGEAPIVDVSTTTREAVLDSNTVDALPTARNYLTLARLIPGTSAGGTDVGGSVIQRVGGSVTVHGSRDQDQRVMLNGVPTQTLQAGGHLGGQVPDVGAVSEVTIEHTAVSAELPTGGIRINFIPRDGGNSFSTSDFFTFSNGSMQGSNFSQRLKDAGLGTPDEVKKNWDMTIAAGGPVRRDKVWFWFSSRRNIAENYVPIFHNVNEYNPNEWLYVPDTSRRGEVRGRVLQSSLRLTWQASPRNKIAGTYKADRFCNCPEQVSATQAPEAARDFRFPRLRQEHLEWTSPVTNRLLLEAVGLHLYERWGNMHPQQGTGSAPEVPVALAEQLISVVEQSSGLRYRSHNNYSNTRVPNFAFRVGATYVTGRHNIKVGMNEIHGEQLTRTYSLNPVSYRFNNGVPNQISLAADPRTIANKQDMDLGLFVQDTISLNRMTVGLALRYDHFATSFPEQVVGPGPLVPNRNITFPAQSNLNWNDLTYRTSLAYDVRGNGQTAIKVTLNKYLRGQTLNALGTDPNPVNAMVNTTNINWTDADRDFTPDCDLLDPAPNGECRGWSSPTFGQAVPGATFDDLLRRGFGHRESNWEFSAGIQHQLMQGVSIDVGYFRRIWQNFRVTDDLSLSAADFDTFSITVPSDSRLPDGGGYVLDGVLALKPEAFGRRAQAHNTLSPAIGERTEHWDGVDVNMNARLRNGLTMQLGTSTGRTAENDCAIVSALPEMLLITGGGGPGRWRAAQFCERAEPFRTQLKGYAVYTIPRIDVQLSGTYRNVPGDAVNAWFAASNAYLAANSTLGRPLAGGASNLTIELLEPNTQFLDRRNELDLRIGKVLRVGRARSVVSLDLFNALNSDAVITANQNFGRFLAPTSILSARVAKISVQFDF
ncbi:MAG: carboxypeptidase regulatory-like domain-containing protein [Vicinamibacterales bacterium]